MATAATISTDSLLKSSGYFECEEWSTEPCMYRCLDVKDCSGVLKTARGYLLRCWRGCEIKEAQK